MATNRLFIYDKETNTAACIAKGYSTGWLTFGESDYINEFFENAPEFTGSLSEDNPTRYELKTEDNLPNDCKIYWPA